jgi:DNA invertase Pin-like site-specific DNA recombinase
MPLKIGAYVRVSTEEQANIIDGSIDSQQHRVKAYLDLKNHQEKNWGKLVETYIDDGFSAKDTKRPAYQRMIRDLRIGKINLILVTDLSRLSRNIADFCKLQDELVAYKAMFLSIKEQFDSTTPAGEMMLFNMINLAQFERKQTAERVALNFHSRALRGLTNGGSKVLGFDRDPANSGKFIVNTNEALIVRRVFEIYLNSRSLAETAKRLQNEGHNPKIQSEKRSRLAREGKWTLHSVRSVLKNMAYIGLREINKCKKSEMQDRLKPYQRYQIVKAAWPSIVSQEVFDNVQKSLTEGLRLEKQRLSLATTRVFLLSGIFRCGECGRALVGQSAHGKTRVHRYYGHSKIDKGNKPCDVKNLRADDVEQAVLNFLDEIILKAGHLNRIEKNMKAHLMATTEDLRLEKDLKENSLHDLEKEIDSVLKFQFSVDAKSSAVTMLTEKLESLAEQRKLLKQSLESVSIRLDCSNDSKASRLNLEENLEKFQKGWKKATPTVQKRFLRRMLDCLVYTKEGIKTFYHLDILNNSKNQNNEKNLAEGKNPSAFSFMGINQSLRRLVATSNLTIESSSDFVCGGL